MKTCGECKHFEWAKGLTGRKLRKMAGKCHGNESGNTATAWLYYDRRVIAPKQVRCVYFDSQMASQCSAFEEKDCAKSGKGVYTSSTRTTNQETIRAPHLSVKISYGTKDTDEIAVQMPDPNQPELAIGGKP